MRERGLESYRWQKAQAAPLPALPAGVVSRAE